MCVMNKTEYPLLCHHCVGEFGGTVGSSPAKLRPHMQIHPWWMVGPTPALILPYFMIS